ncbi:uncharacterized protein LOC111696896 [Eurytemora carolleeae]|uniref:uncharacterized protein LOC111696896 n=1 Tax=Eurytemora carolleeae TaxID=1294199 RepID=UPI000C786E32|nr:uncharacterized protein LOC111696896 [Eurytemora carolleeae]|eukprot:XP_023322441.1 uncharacterized protein LOC111696896 [Eurytemora affinis]
MSTLKTKQLENIDLEKKLQKVKTRKNIEKWRMHSRKLQKELEQRKMNGEEINLMKNPPLGIDPDWNIETGSLGENVNRKTVRSQAVLKEREMIEEMIDQEVSNVITRTGSPSGVRPELTSQCIDKIQRLEGKLHKMKILTKA